MDDLEYYSVTTPGGHQTVSVWDKRVHRMFSWVANTECWHRHDAREQDFWFERANTWEQIDAQHAAELVARASRADERSLGWVIDELRAQPDTDRRTSAELGIPVTGRRIFSEELIARRLHDVDDEQWVDIVVYPPGTSSGPAQALASDLRRQARKALTALGDLEAETSTSPDGWITVRARRATKPATRVQRRRQRR